MSELKPIQEKAAVLLASGKTARDVAKEVDVTPETISHWRQIASFRALEHKLKWEALNSARDEMQALTSKAVSTLKDVMQNGKTDAARLKAAEIVLMHVGMTDPGSGLWGWGID
jgi:hypothetical protein